jgi:hypothetical protein
LLPRICRVPGDHRKSSTFQAFALLISVRE